MMFDSAQPFHLLLVDDREDSHLLVSTYLEELKNVQMDSAKTGAECLDKVILKKFDLIFLDLHLADENGYVVLKKIKEHAHDIPVIILSADGSEENIQKSISLGADAHLVKPIKKSTVLDVLSFYFK